VKRAGSQKGKGSAKESMKISPDIEVKIAKIDLFD